MLYYVIPRIAKSPGSKARYTVIVVEMCEGLALPRNLEDFFSEEVMYRISARRCAIKGSVVSRRVLFEGCAVVMKKQVGKVRKAKVLR